MRLRVGLLLPLVMAGCLGAAPVASAPAGGGEMSAAATAVLKGLQERAGTLKNFTAGVEISTEHPAGDVDERSGTAVYVQGTAGVGAAVGGGKPTKFSAHFTKSSTGAAPDDEIIFDGTKVVMVDHRAKTYRTTVLAGTGGGAGGVTSLDGPMPLPIGLDPAEVLKKFDVTVTKEDDATAELNLKVKPAAKADFDYRNLAVTVDKKLGLPVKMVMKQKSQDVMTIKLTDVKVDGAGAEVVMPAEPKEPGWVVEEK